MKNVVIIGGGPAGMIAGIYASKNNKVTLIEQNEKLGKKLYITGKGRCNITNSSDEQGLIDNVVSNPFFLYSAFYSFNSSAVIDFFEKEGLKLKVERGNRVFPCSDKSSDVIKVLSDALKNNNVDIMLNTKVTDLIVTDGKIEGVILSNGKKIKANKVIVATGGLSYKSTGSTGDGYKFAKKVKHTVVDTYPSLVGLNGEDLNLQGLSLRNVNATVYVDKKVIYEEFGELLFTHYGVSGPIILKTSVHLIGNYKKNIEIKIDLKPALSEKALDKRILRDFDEYKNKDLKNALNNLLPQKIIDKVIEKSKIDKNKKVNEITKEERKNLCDVIKGFSVKIHSSRGYEEAVITKGGVNVDEIDPSTMESKLVKGLFFAGEVIDVDAFTGGYNLQIAFSTGYLAGKDF